MSASLLSTITPPDCGGNLFAGDGRGFGADGGYLQSITFSGYSYTYNHVAGTISASGGTYSYNGTTHTLTITDSHGGTLSLGMDNGTYTYRASSTLSSADAYSSALDVVLIDKDGDTASGSITLDVARAMGGSGNDTISGTGNADIIIGASGSDQMTGGAGADTFRWILGDASGSPTDTITDFNTALPASAGDILDLRDLLVGESHVGTAPGNLGSYLHFSYSAGADATTIQVTTHDASSNTQQIVLQHVDLTSGGALSSDSAVIQDLLTKGKLITD